MIFPIYQSKTLHMPQLIPYYFSNENNFSFVLLVFLVYVFSRYVLPVPNSLTSSRSFLFNL